MRRIRTSGLLLLTLLICAGCPHKTLKDFHGDDKTMVEAAKQIEQAINAYHADTADWPPDIRAAEKYLPPGTGWPDNPYTHTPISDNGSATFDPAKSVGTVYYEKFVRDDQVMNYQLYVFGKTGQLMIFGNSAFGAQ
jgi:hypothetical protein